MTAQTPVPPSANKGGDDPSALATQQVWREIEHVTQLANTRFDAMDKAITLLQDFANRAPTIVVVDGELKSLKELLHERFEFIQSQFAKSDQSTTKELDAVKALIAANTKATDDKIAALVLRLSEMNGQSAGLEKGWGWIVAGFGLILTLASIAAALIAIFR